MSSNELPWVTEPPPEVPLKMAPLVRVLAQVRFPLIASVEQQDFIAPFQEAIRRDYPVLRPNRSRGVVLGPTGVVGTPSITNWRFQDSKQEWRVSLAPDFLSLETSDYTSRKDFLKRLRYVLEALRDHVDPRVIDRIGIRYIDRVSDQGHLNDLPNLVRPEVAGVMSTPLAAHTIQAISENVFTLPGTDSQLIARWGLMPPQSTVDPGAVDPINELSWLLDTDAFVARTQDFDVDDVMAQALTLAKHVYGFFRWAVNDEFLKKYGGNP